MNDARTFLLEDDQIREAFEQAKHVLFDEASMIRKMEEFAWAYFTRTDLRVLLLRHPDHEAVTRACLHFLGDEAQEWWAAKDSVPSVPLC